MRIFGQVKGRRYPVPYYPVRRDETPTESRLCPHCGEVRPLTWFVSKTGREVKCCSVCREYARKAIALRRKRAS